ncbi:ACT domain-containing protein [Ammonifex thiophilus]|uniref:ACT domain-containing protein n=1 Tax=Ammonifex thiophilus TaxID=444093 RepID=A0A3D8P7C4_9THEO|nr:ACT domain-containing protein [Ammonifex thiophilus]RDV84325.1 ACT domain-containing protein [Ammonifex thiophilus]
MSVKQISVFLENKSGRLAAVARLLASRGINIRALSIADTSDFGILRLIVDRPEEAYRALKEEGFTVSLTDVLAVAVPDRPGGLAPALEALSEANLNIEYLYAFVARHADQALVLLKVDDRERAVKVLEEAGFKVPSPEEIYSL